MRSLLRLFRAALPLSCGVLVSCLPLTGQSGGAVTPSTCTVREIGRDPLVVEGGNRLYVEPYALEADDRGNALLAGRFNFLFEPQQDGQWLPAGESHILGALVPREGEARLVRSPVPTSRLGSIRVLPQGDGTWAVTFVEVEPTTEGSRASAPVARLWGGTYDGARWTTLDTLPRPPQADLHSATTSALISRGDTLFWAVRARQEHTFDVALFERRGGRWSSEIIPTRMMADMQLTYEDSVGLLLAVVQPDPALRADFNSLLLWARHPSWHVLRRLVHGYGEGRVYRPQFTRSVQGTTLTWMSSPASDTQGSRDEIRTIRDFMDPTDRPRMVIDSSAQHATVLTLDDVSWWVTDHEPMGGGEKEIRFVRDQNGSPVLVGKLPNPYSTPFRAVALSRSTVVSSGALIEPPSRGGVVTLLLRFEVQCT